MIKLSHLFITEPLNILINSALWGYCTLVCSLRDKSQRQTRLLNNDLMNSRYRDRNCSYLETQINFLPQISCENLFYSLFEQCFSVRGDFAPLAQKTFGNVCRTFRLSQLGRGCADIMWGEAGVCATPGQPPPPPP